MKIVNMMNVIVIGINHETAPIEIREMFYLSQDEQKQMIGLVMQHHLIKECFVLSTCNRTEIYAVVAGCSLDSHCLIDQLIAYKNLSHTSALDHCFYTYQNDSAIQHLLEVACGLDSLIIGETQILGQLKRSIDMARNVSSIGIYFNILSNIAIRSGKKARHDTHINCGGTSISWAAVNLAENHFGTLENKSFLIIGAGKMGSITGEQLIRKNISQLYFVNRTYDKAKSLAQRLGGHALPFSSLENAIGRADICISSYIIDREMLDKIPHVNANRERLMIDISVPRNIDPQVGKISTITLYDIDNLKEAMDINVERRQQAKNCVNELIERKMFEFRKKIKKSAERKNKVDESNMCTV